ncbi:MAG: UDP-N-acetylglucosamine 2-epimerase (hydrolyzing) [SAR202 cluster bacterium]|nr:UDP-N-acetylglucosamine 2-epimerase (hydrolyzing) [SAR202 cluster bacterium]
MKPERTQVPHSGRRHVMYITGTRADYGLMRDTLRAIDQHPRLRLSILVTGMHLLKEFGDTLQEVEKDGYPISHKVEMLGGGDSPKAMAQSLGRAVVEMAEAFGKSQPDFILLEGDRGESLAAAIAAAHMNVGVAHASGGDVSGTIDESIRHAITKFAHIHFPGTSLSARRILAMGEDPWRVHMVGTPGSTLKVEPPMTKADVGKMLGTNLTGPVIVVLQHPVTTEADDAGRQMRETMEAVRGFGVRTVLIYPNSDAGGRAMMEVIKEYERQPFLATFKNLPRPTYVALLSVADVLVGNSSSALSNAPNFGLPAVNVGTRQQGRERGGNIIDAGYDREEIQRAIQYALDHGDDQAFRAKCRQSPFRDDDAGAKIADVLASVEMGPKLIQKRFFDGALADTGAVALGARSR